MLRWNAQHWPLSRPSDTACHPAMVSGVLSGGTSSCGVGMSSSAPSTGSRSSLIEPRRRSPCKSHCRSGALPQASLRQHRDSGDLVELARPLGRDLRTGVVAHGAAGVPQPAWGRLAVLLNWSVPWQPLYCTISPPPPGRHAVCVRLCPLATSRSRYGDPRRPTALAHDLRCDSFFEARGCLGVERAGDCL